MGWIDGVRFLARERDIYLLYSIQTISAAHLTFFSVSTRCSLLRQKGTSGGYPLSSSAGVKNDGAISLIPYTSSWHGA
jgi:hypothetical protein